MMSLKQLENDFSDVLHAPLPVIPQKVETLFDIAGFPHYETVNSNFYSYFLNPKNSHGFGDMFLSTLGSIIESKTGSKVLDNHNFCDVKREVFTINGKYIDIVIAESSENENLAENAIIIENKLGAELYNDLHEYYNHITVKHKKLGVVLSLKKEANLPDQYINITHQEYVTALEQAAGSYFLSADIKSLMLFKEFIQNVKSMSSSIDMKDQYEFYFKYEDKIYQIAELYKSVTNDVFRQAGEACEKLDMGLELKAQSHSLLRYFVSKKAPVYFTVWLYDLFNGDGEITVMVELDAEGMKFLDAINKIDFSDEERQLLKETTKVRKTYIHYATKSSKPNNEQLQNFTNYIINEIVGSPLQSIFSRIETKIYELVRGSLPE